MFCQLFIGMDFKNNFPDSSMGDEDVCLVDSATTHTILKDQKYFLKLTLATANVYTISSTSNMIEGSGKANLILPCGTKLDIHDALYSSRSRRNLLSFKDIRCKGYHIETTDENDMEYLCITSIISGKKHILEKLPALHSGLYNSSIRTVESYAILNQKFNDSKIFVLWHDRLGHPGSTMMRQIIENSNGHSLKNMQILSPNNFTCRACSQGKLVVKPSPTKVSIESPTFLQRIQGDICGPIHPPCGPFRYFMVLIDASARLSHVCLLSTRNHAFARLLAQIIRLQSQFLDYPIKFIHLDGAGKFTSQAFDHYCMSVGIDVEHSVAHIHT